jgi:RNA polymerase sigma-70 factor (ECF subfamily)
MDAYVSFCPAIPVSVTLPVAGADSPRRGIFLSATVDSSTQALNGFLASVERKAFRMAQMALRHDEDALDAVQDAMLQLARRYSHRPCAEWPPLFYRILENRIRDMQRRRMVRSRVLAWLPWSSEDETDNDPIERAPDPAPGPAAEVEGSQIGAALQRAVGLLPARQREAFLLRNLEGFDVAQTAAAMGCSEGSVKTHYSRAVHSLRKQLGECMT